MKLTLAGQASGTYLYRALDSEGNTVDFLLSPHRNRVAAKHFLQLALWRVGHLRPRAINVDGHPAYPSVIAELKQTGQFPKSCRCRPSRYMNNVIEQDHRFIKKRIVASQGFRSVEGALNTMQGHEAMHTMFKGQIRWLKKGDVVGQLRFVNRFSALLLDARKLALVLAYCYQFETQSLDFLSASRARRHSANPLSPIRSIPQRSRPSRVRSAAQTSVPLTAPGRSEKPI